MKLKISTVGESVLRQQARPLSLDEIQSPYIQSLIEHMCETMRDAPGVGLAAPQIGLPLQMAVIEDRAEYHKGLTDLKEKEREVVPFHVIINPRIQIVGPCDIEFFEGCLSLPGYTAIVPRSSKVLVECLNEKGEPQRIEASGWYARILQHEIDHLYGSLYIDRMYSRTFASLENYNRTWKEKTIQESLNVLVQGKKLD